MSFLKLTESVSYTGSYLASWEVASQLGLNLVKSQENNSTKSKTNTNTNSTVIQSFTDEVLGLKEELASG